MGQANDKASKADKDAVSKPTPTIKSVPAKMLKPKGEEESNAAALLRFQREADALLVHRDKEAAKLASFLPLPSQPTKPALEESLTMPFTLRLTSRRCSNYGKNRLNYYYWQVTLKALGKPALLYGVAALIESAVIIAPAPVVTWYDASKQPLNEFKFMEMPMTPGVEYTRHGQQIVNARTVPVQYGHHLDLKGSVRLTDGSVIPFSHHIKGLDDPPTAGVGVLPVEWGDDAGPAPPVTVINAVITGLPKLREMDYTFPNFMFTLDQAEPSKVTKLQYEGKMIKEVTCQYHNTHLSLTFTAPGKDKATSISYDGYTYNYNNYDTLEEPVITPSEHTHPLCRLKGLPTAMLEDLLLRIRPSALRTIKRKKRLEALLLSATPHLRLAPPSATASQFLQENLMVPLEDIAVIIDHLEDTIRAHHVRATWRPVSTGSEEDDISWRSDAQDNKVAKPSFEAILPIDLAQRPELAMVWAAVTDVLWGWEKTSTRNWRIRGARQNMLRDEVKHVYNTQEQLLLRLVLKRLNTTHPELVLSKDSVEIIGSFLHPARRGGLLFGATTQDNASWVDRYTKVGLRLDPVLWRYHFVSEAEDKVWTSHSYSLDYVVGSYCLDGDRLTFKQDGNTYHWTKGKEGEATYVRSEAKAIVPPEGIRLLNDCQYGGLCLVSPDGVWRAITQREAQLRNQTFITELQA